MVWSEQVGVSIIVPSDRVEGDRRNYIVIGADVPAAVADNFTAALVFRNGSFTGSDPVAGNNYDVSGSVGNLYPNGFVYWVLGISTAGRFEIVAFYLVVPSPGSQQFFTYRQTVLSISPPIGIDSAPVLSIGNVPAFSSYSEGAVRVLAQQVDSTAGVIALNTLGFYNDTQWTDYITFFPGDLTWGVVTVHIDAMGYVNFRGLAALATGTVGAGAGTTIGKLPAKYAPRRAYLGTAQVLNVACRIQVMPDGSVQVASPNSPALAPGNFVSLSDIRYPSTSVY